MKLNVNQIKTILQPQNTLLRNTYHVTKIGIFGSTATNENTEKSDIDMLIEFSKPIGFFKFIEVEEFLTNTIGKKVDLVTQKGLKPAMKEKILKQVIYV